MSLLKCQKLAEDVYVYKKPRDLTSQDITGSLMIQDMEWMTLDYLVKISVDNPETSSNNDTMVCTYSINNNMWKWTFINMTAIAAIANGSIILLMVHLLAMYSI